MFELQGKYSTAKVFTDVVDDSSISQIQTLVDQRFTEGTKVRMMPDVHAGKGCTIGTTMTIKDKIVPNLVGVDISCGVLVAKLKEKKLDLERLDKCIRRAVPCGRAVRNKPHRWADRVDIMQLRCIDHIKRPEQQILAIGSIGSGNHFAEIDRDDDENLYLVIHCGSRNLGLQVANYYQQAAYDALHGRDAANLAAEKQAKKDLIDRLTAEGRAKEISKALKEFKFIPDVDKETMDICYELSYCEGQLFEDYIHDMKILQQFASLNREAILDSIECGMRFGVEDFFQTTHNYIDTDSMILRKGAISAKAGETAIIPINMRDGSLIVRGKGNPDWNYSAPHGAGRLMSRKQAKDTFTVSEFKKQMEGIFTTTANQSTLDECPMAYKGMEDIVNNIGPTADILYVIKPIYNFKAEE